MQGERIGITSVVPLTWAALEKAARLQRRARKTKILYIEKILREILFEYIFF